MDQILILTLGYELEVATVSCSWISGPALEQSWSAHKTQLIALAIHFSPFGWSNGDKSL